MPKELIQNADDAGATHVKFLYDARANDDALSCLIDEGMRGAQGPALWAFNDAVFQEQDFVNITKLSGATKVGEDELALVMEGRAKRVFCCGEVVMDLSIWEW